MAAALAHARHLAERVSEEAAPIVRRVWHSVRAHEHHLAQRHGVHHVPARARALAPVTAFLLISGLGAALAVSAGASGVPPSSAPTLATDELSRLRVPLPSATSTEVAGAAIATDTAVQAAPEPLPTTAAPAPAEASTLKLLPTGKGMWFHFLDQTGLSPDQIVAQAKASGLTHLYVRVGSSKKGFNGAPELDLILPAAHAAGLQVIGWDFPYLHDPNVDIQRAVDAIAYTTPDGHRIDAFSADIETGSEGVQLAADRVEYYAANVRYYVGPGYPLIGTVPNACLNETFPYAEVARHFDAIAPMVYWITRDPGADVACNIERLAPLGRAVMPIGQAYDPAIDNPTLVGLTPGYDHLALFMRTAAEKGAAAVSFWAWHTASPDMWRAIADAPWYSLVPMAPGHEVPEQVAVLQRVLNLYGYGVPPDGQYGPGTVGALAQLQSDLGLDPTGTLDEMTIRALTARG